jgi:hypothetical protein
MATQSEVAVVVEIARYAHLNGLDRSEALDLLSEARSLASDSGRDHLLSIDAERVISLDSIRRYIGPEASV